MNCNLCRYRRVSEDTPGNTRCLAIKTHPAFKDLSEMKKTALEIDAVLGVFPYSTKDGDPAITFSEKYTLWPKDFHESEIDTCNLYDLKANASSFETLS